MNNTLNILMQSSDFYCPFAGVAMESLFENNTDIEKLTVYLISDNISKINLEKIDSLSQRFGRKIVIIDGNKISSMLSDMGFPKYHGSYATYYKLFVYDFIEENVKSLLYLDSDIIVNGSFKDLIDYNFNGKTLAMAVDLATEEHKKYVVGADRKMYNAGVIYMNWEKCKEIKFTQKIMEHIVNVRSNYSLADQDILNVVFMDDIQELGNEYNLNTDFLIYKDYDIIEKVYGIKYGYSEKIYTAFKKHIVYHCAGTVTSRPWCKNSRHPLAELWDEYLSRSPWKDYQKCDDTRTLPFKIQGFLHRILPIRLFAFINRLSCAWIQKYRNTHGKVA